MAKAKSPRTTKAKAENNIEKKVVQMPEPSGNGNGDLPLDLQSEIRVRAYQLYEERGYANGRSEDDWFQAEREVMARHAHAHTA